MALVKHTNNSLSNITALPSAVPTGKMTLLSTATASNSASLSFNSTYINSDYLIYKFEFINIHPITDNVQWMHNASTDNGSNYNLVKTNTVFEGEKAEGSDAPTLNYVTGHDIAQGTGNAKFTYNCGNDNDQSLSGEMFLFNPSSTVFVKHFITKVANSHNSNYIKNTYTAGYYNTTSDIDALIFLYSSGNIGSGVIKLYGLGN